MITIDDHDLPVTVAQKLVTATRPNDTSEAAKAMARLITGIPDAGETIDMFTVDELREIADYLIVYCDAHKDGD